jgi:pilus assembly protein TadC
VNKAEELEEEERAESRRINKKTFIIIMLIFLFLNLSLSLLILEKVNKIWNFTVQQN